MTGRINSNPFVFVQAGEVANDTRLESSKMLIKAGFVQMLGSGLYTYLPFGLRILQKICTIIHQECATAGLLHIDAPTMQPGALWDESGRLHGAYLDEKLVIKDKRDAYLVYQPTGEEAATDAFRTVIKSYKQLPLVLYQLNSKFRDEIRPRAGLQRAREFIMLDAYSFDHSAENATKTYHSVNQLYLRILGRLGLNPVAAEQAEVGDVGGTMSHELLVESPNGESRVGYRADGSAVILEGDVTPNDVLRVAQCVEVGHNFHLGTKYSEAMHAYVDCEDGKRRPADMGCYGIGVSRLLAVLADLALTDGKLYWPPGLEPYKICVVPLAELPDADALLDELRATYSNDVVVDDRPLSLGHRLHDAEMVGIPVRIVLGREERAQGTITIKHNGGSKTLPRTEMMAYLAAL